MNLQNEKKGFWLIFHLCVNSYCIFFDFDFKKWVVWVISVPQLAE